MDIKLQDEINKQAEASKNNMLWGKPANDILNGRDNSASANPIRAVWYRMLETFRQIKVI